MSTTTDPRSADRRELAIRRIEARSEFATHASAYVLVNAIIVTIWFLVSDGGLFWPIFPILGWGLGLFFHGVETYRRPPTEARIQREMEKLG